MYKLILLDDEPVILEGLQKIIDWPALDIEIVGTFEYPKNAFEFMLNNHVDIAIVDICIPGKSGLDFIKEIHESGIPAHFIVLSGYNDFAYAQTAVGLGVHGYVLKPVVVEELMDVLESVKSCIYRESLSSLRDFELDLREHLTSGSISKRLRNHFEMVDFPRDFFSCFCILPKREHTPLLPSILDSFRQFSDEQHETGRFASLPFIYQKSLVILTGWDARCSNNDFLNKVEISVRDHMQKYHFDIIAGITHSSPGISIEDVCNLYKESVKQAEHNLFFYGYHEIENDADIAKIENLLFQKLKQGDTESLSTLVYSFFSVCAEEFEYDISIIKDSCKELLIRLLFQLQDFIHLPLIHNKEDIFDQINSAEIHEELTGIILRVFYNFIAGVGKSVQEVEDERISKIKRYVCTHLSSKITLENIAQEVYLNPSYISIFFKLQTGENLKAYIASKRESQAVNMLLHTDMKIYEIADHVGYQSTRRFSDYFRKHTGYLPTEYRQRFKISQIDKSG